MKLLPCMLFLSLAGSVALPAQTTTVPQCIAKPEWLLHVRRPDTGWNISNIDRNAKLGSGEGSLSGLGSQRIVKTEYRIRNPYFTYTEILVDPCTHSASLRNRQLRLEQAYGYALGGKTFAFVLFGNCGEMGKAGWIAAGCDTYLTLVDTTGSGKFDTLEIGKYLPDSVPNWVTEKP